MAGLSALVGKKRNNDFVNHSVWVGGGEVWDIKLIRIFPICIFQMIHGSLTMMSCIYNA